MELLQELLIRYGGWVFNDNAGSPLKLMQVEGIIGLAHLLKELVDRCSHLI